MELTKKINEKRARGEDTSRLDRALQDLTGSQAQIRKTQEEFTSQLPTNKEVVGSSLRLGASLALPSLAKGVTPGLLPGYKGLEAVSGLSKAQGAFQGVKAGAKLGALTGAVEGAAHGAGVGLEQNKDALGVAKSSALGSVMGGVTGGALGGIFGGFAGKSNASKVKAKQVEELLNTKPDSRAAQYMLEGGKVVDDPIAKEAVKQGVSEPTTALIKGASAADKAKANQMLDILEKGRFDKKFSATNRPSDVIGNSVTDRLKIVADTNKAAKNQLDTVAKSLKGQSIDPEDALVTFKDDLEAMRISFKDGKPVFSGSDIEGLDGPQGALNKLFTRMKNISSDDPYEIHRLKQYIDEVVDYGEGSGGISGKTETIIKKLRHNLDAVLDANFPDYNQVNSTYSATRKAMDSFADAMGTKFNPNLPNPEKYIGTRARAILSNQQSRVQVINALQELQDIAEANGGKFADDIVTQTLFVDEIEKLLPPVNSTSLAGEVRKGFGKAATITTRLQQGTGPIELAMQGAGHLLEAGRNINEEQLIKVLRQMLSR